MLQNHRADQELACHGCKEFFKSASGLMRHIEDNECSIISQTRLLQEKSKKLMIKEALKAGEGSPMPVVPEHSDLDDIDGGVKVDRLEATNREAMMNQPKRGQDDPTASFDAMLGLKHWPKLSDKKNVAPGELMSFSDAGSPSKSRKQGSSVVSEASRGGLFNGRLPESGQTLRLLDREWDATKFFNSFTGKYVCICGVSFDTMKEFEHHSLMKSKAKNNIRYALLPWPPCAIVILADF